MRCQFAAARQVVGVNVSLRDVADAKTMLGCSRKVPVDVAVRIDDERLAGALAPDQIARLCEAVVIESPDQQGTETPTGGT